MNRASCLVIVLLLSAASATAQSLGEISKQEEARRKTVKTPSKVITNEDLKRFGPIVPPPATEQKPEPAQPATKADAATPAAGQAQAAAASDEPVKDEAWWHKRITDARETLDRSKVLLEALQSRANALWADFTARDDPAQRAVIANDRARALAEIDRMKSGIEAQTKAIASIEEEARKAGVPPGWLR